MRNAAALVVLLAIAVSRECGAALRAVCIDCPAIVADVDVMRSLANMVVMSPAIQEAEMSAFLTRSETGSFRHIPWSRDAATHRSSYRGALPDQLSAIVHTHPARRSRPSADDAALAVRIGIPVIVLTRAAIWVAEPAHGQLILIVDDSRWCHRALAVPETSLAERPLALDPAPLAAASAPTARQPG